MFFVLKLTVFFLVVSNIGVTTQGKDVDFTCYGFGGAKLSLDGIAQITSNGLLRLTTDTKQTIGHAFYTNPIHFLNHSSTGSTSVLSFSTTFVFAILSQYSDLSGHGMAFVIAPTRGLPGAFASDYLGLFNYTDNGKLTNHVFSVELDTVRSALFNDINDNHVGIDMNGLQSVASTPAYYFENIGRPVNLTLVSGQAMRVWVDYDGVHKHLNVTLAPINVSKPALPLLSKLLDLSPIMEESMFVGFSASTGSVPTSHYVLGWSFKLNGKAKELDISQLPKLPHKRRKPAILTIWLPIIASALLLVIVVGTLIMVRRKVKYEEVLEDWELDYGPHRFKYKDLYMATEGFKHNELVGIGGFGKVYRGVLPISKIEVAVKKISHDSKQGMKEFVAEIVSVGQLRHRNLVPLLGYCRRKGELLLVYEFMPNGSLDKFLFDSSMPKLNWVQRFRIIRGVASALFYLHEECDQVVLHRDVKSANVLLDGEMNGRLGDFGLAKLHDRGTDPQITQVVGTMGYLAPELSRTGLPNPSTDVFGFGAFTLEVICGRRPIDPRASSAEEQILVDWVFSCKRKGTILETVDPNMGIKYAEMNEMELVLNLGLLCSHCDPTERPTMRQVVQYLEGELPLPDLSSLGLLASGMTSADREGFLEVLNLSYPSSTQKKKTLSSPLVSGLVLSGGR
ncbi:L-type lectin-domain containing receptor kinase IV.1-like [Macadamia integrifolia]|uniref:L-type lectin-domain containing receptor kinase IV.1-like n=1 Tax=Macadamia integrifolia TaxID=60698 RepID=UPI001C4FB802|nr:L-type lectin-domain containing receptor kinase IV.1-like [Macadamia integrifolia]